MRSAAAALGLFAILATIPAWAAGDVATGRKLAIERCSRCHVVGDYNPMGGIESTIDFDTMASRPAVYPAERIRSFNERPPHPQLGIELTRVERDSIAAFVASLGKH